MNTKMYVVGMGAVYEYKIPFENFATVSASAKYGDNIPEDILNKIWGYLSLGHSIQDAFTKVGLPHPVNRIGI